MGLPVRVPASQVKGWSKQVKVKAKEAAKSRLKEMKAEAAELGAQRSNAAYMMGVKPDGNVGAWSALVEDQEDRKKFRRLRMGIVPGAKIAMARTVPGFQGAERMPKY